MKHFYNVLSFFLFLTYHNTALSQGLNSANLRSFSVMVIPFTLEGQKINDQLQKDANLRIAIATVQDIFAANGLRIVDFGAKYQKYYQDRVMKDPTSDTKALFVEYASPDIYAEIETEHIDCGDDTHKARIKIKTFLTATSELMADRVSDSNCFVRQTDFVQLVKQSINKFIAEYIERLESALVLMEDVGQPLQLHITISDKAGYDMNSLVKSANNIQGEAIPLSKSIPLWLHDNQIVRSFNTLGGSAQTLIFDEIRIPLFDENKKKIFAPDIFRLQLWLFFNDIGLIGLDGRDKLSVKDHSIGRTLYITLE